MHNCSLHFHLYKMAITYLFHSFITHHTQFSSTTFIHPINHYLSPHMYIYCKYYIFIFCNHLLVNAPNFYYTTTNCNPPTDFHSRNYPIIISRYLPIYLIVISSSNNCHLDRGFSSYPPNLPPILIMQFTIVLVFGH